MSTLIALAGNEILLPDVAEEVKGDLEWLLNLPQERFEDPKDTSRCTSCKGTDFDEWYGTE
ncbi:hypothetical protein ACHAQJ_003507 [Trichoderma viride]